MKRIQCVILYLSVTLCALFLLNSCGKGKFEKIPRTTFISHYEENKEELKPFVSYWRDPKLKDTVQVQPDGKTRKVQLYIKPVNLNYFVKNSRSERHKKDIEHLQGYFNTALTKAFKKREQEVPGFQLLTKPSGRAYTLEVAIVAAEPTPVEGNVLSQALGVFKQVAGLVAGQIEKKGHIAMAAKFTAPNGRCLAELADYSEDQSAILGVDLKDFNYFAHHRHRIDLWSKQLAETFTSPKEAKIKGAPRISLVPF